jgi:hypothetical protein
MKKKNQGVDLNSVIDAALARIKAEAMEHATKLGLPAKGTKDVAAEEWNFWDEQSEDWDGEDLWRSFPEAIAARVRCLWALDICLIPFEYIGESGGGGRLRDAIKTVDRNLEVLRTYAPKAAPEKEARAWLAKDKIKRQIRELKSKLRAAA